LPEEHTVPAAKSDQMEGNDTPTAHSGIAAAAQSGPTEGNDTLTASGGFPAALEQEIRSTRVGGFGSSDAAMIYNVGLTGIINNTARERIAVYLGLKEPPSFTNEYIERGKRREQEIFEIVKDGNKYGIPNFYSNPCYENQELTAASGIRCFTHIDIVRQDEKYVTFYEVKSSTKSYMEVSDLYQHQMNWHRWCLEDNFPNYCKSIYLMYYFENGSEEFIHDNLIYTS
jgi:hypothetical protein